MKASILFFLFFYPFYWLSKVANKKTKRELRIQRQGFDQAVALEHMSEDQGLPLLWSSEQPRIFETSYNRSKGREKAQHCEEEGKRVVVLLARRGFHIFLGSLKVFSIESLLSCFSEIRLHFSPCYFCVKMIWYMFWYSYFMLHKFW